MQDLPEFVDGLIDRASNRLIWSLAPKTRRVATAAPLVSFTFDDVPDSAWRNGAAILEKYGARGTFYISGSLEGRIEPRRQLITREGCLGLFERGHEIGCHTFGHGKIRNYGGPALAADLDRSAQYLREIGITAHPNNFAYPYNAAWPLARRELSNRFHTCRGAGAAINRGAVDPMMLKAVEIRQPEHEARDLTHWIDDVAKNPGWLIFFTHDVKKDPTDYGVTPDTFEHLVRHCLDRGCRIATVEDAVHSLGWKDDAE
ncbi:MAG: polysaccharide deacetylase family protein [Neorhizobium sp.]|jgi:peptidoglycan/xylan/chitin deacetylase (PgdA/CDA1 family)|nr:polysaccharide deacetylase family protein [Neorhizobium sp.]